VRESRHQKVRKVADLPTPAMSDPAEIYENNTVSFVDQEELRFLMREKARVKLAEAIAKKTPGVEVVVPDCSDLETQTRAFLKKLQALAKIDDRASRLEIELLKKTFDTPSLLNISVALARMRLREQETSKLKFWYSGEASGFLDTNLDNDFGKGRYRLPSSVTSGKADPSDWT
jgi:hypothetical protein